MTTDDALEITRVFAAPPERVFAAWLERDRFAAWIGPEGIQCEVPLHEPRIGGAYRITMRLSDGRVIPVAGVFRTIEPPTRLAFTWGWEGDPSRDSLVTVTLRPHGDGTALTLRQEGLGAGTRDDHARGWTGTLNKLSRYVTAPYITKGAPQ